MPSRPGRRQSQESLQPRSSTAQLTRSVLWKTDTRLLPFLAVLFQLNSLDKSNIGNAETANFTKDAGLEPQDLNDAVSLFFLFFVLLQPISTALGKRVGPEKWVPGVILVWAVLTTLHAFVRTRGQLIGLRILIGIFESGFYPTTVFYLGIFYTRFEFATRLALFYGQYAVAGAFGGLLSYVVFRIFPSSDDTQEMVPTGFRNWQILFMLEGGVTFVIAIIAFWWMPKSPASAWFLSPQERTWAKKRIEMDRSLDDSDAEEEIQYREQDEEDYSSSLLSRSGTLQKTDDTGLSPRDVYSALNFWPIHIILPLNILSAIPVTAFSIFLPLIIKGMGFDGVLSNIMTVPPYLTGGAVLLLLTYMSDNRKDRLNFVLAGIGITIVGLVIITFLPPNYYVLKYIGLCIVIGGCFVASPITIAWISGNIQSPGKRAVILGINGWGSLSGVFSSALFSPKFKPDYGKPFTVTLVLVIISFFGFYWFRGTLVQENRHKAITLSRWSAEEQEAERNWGRGPPIRRDKGSCYWNAVQSLARKLTGFDDRDVDRVGDEKMSWTWSL